jgi:hypothetical protein
MMQKVKVVGTGGIGLCLLPVLCRFINYEAKKFPVAEVHLIDGDEFEARNAERQDFNEIGPKATVTANQLRQKFGRIRIVDHPVFLSEDNIVPHIRENDIVILAVDNHNSRKIVSDRAIELNNITVISGGNDLHDGNVLIHIRRDGKDLTPPLASQYHPEIASPDDLHPSQLNQPGSCSRQAEQTPQLVIVNNLIAANMLSAFYNLTDSEVFRSKVLKSPEKYGEVLLDMVVMSGVVRDRFVS